jgi:soluble lytic murein transglycosylase
MDLSRVERAARADPHAAFYAAYLLEKEIPSYDLDSADTVHADEVVVKLYKSALRDETVRDAAAERLRPFVLANKKTAAEVVGISSTTPALRALKTASMLTLGYYSNVIKLYRDDAPSDGVEERPSWDRAILLLARLMQTGGERESSLHEDMLEFFLLGDIENARRWLWNEITLRTESSRREIALFSEAEESAVRGRFYAADNAYRGALAVFRTSYDLDAGLYTRYSSLFNDLGRSYFYGGFYEEGAALFLDWEAAASDNEGEIQHLRDFRYLCLYYAGRMSRAVGKRDQAAGHFNRAVEFAPDLLQRDACIWYIIEMGFGQNMKTGIALIEKWADSWHDGDYFADLYDRVAQWAASSNNWNVLLDLFPTIERGKSGLTRAKYAYMIGRALEEGFISSRDRTPEAFFTITYNENTAPYYYYEQHLYYRAMAGLRLGKEPDFIERSRPPTTPAILTREGRLLEGFFTYGAVPYASAWIREYADTLPLEELRALVGRLGEENFWGEAIRLCTIYMKRPDFVLTPEDIALYFPRGYAELVTRFAEEYRIDRGIFFGLVRTESIFIPDIISSAGAGGLTQLMPQTALETARTMAREGGPDYVLDDTVDRADPEANVHIGAYFLRQLMNTQASPLNAILSYNGGPTRIRRWARASRLPPDLFMESVELRETREYGKKVLACAILYDYFYFSLKSDRLVADILGN